MNSSKKRNRLLLSTVLRWFASYFLCVIAVALMVGFVGARLTEGLSQSIRENQRERVSSVGESIQILLSETEDAVLQMMGSSELMILVRNAAPYTPHQLAVLYDFTRTFKGILASHSSWSNTTIYLAKSDCMLESAVKRTPKEVYERGDYAIGYEEWMRRLDSLSGKSYFHFTSRTMEEKYYVELWYPIVGKRRSKHDGVVMLRFNLSSLSTIVSGMRFHENERLLLLSPNNELMFCSDNAKAFTTPTLLKEAMHQPGVSTAEAVNAQSGWRCVSILDDSFLMARADQYQVFVRRICFAMLALGFVVVIIACVCRLRPVRRLYDLTDGMLEGAPSSQTIYKHIEHSYEAMRSEVSSAQAHMKNERLLARNQMLTRMLYGVRKYGGVPTSPEIYSAYGIHFISQRFLVLLIDYANASDLYSESNENCDYEEFAQELLAQQAQEVLSPRLSIYCLQYMDRCTVIVNPEDGAAHGEVVRMLRKGCADIAERLMSRWGLKIMCSLSDECQNATGIARAYNHAIDVYEVQQITGEAMDSFVCYEDVSFGDHAAHMLEMDWQQMTALIKQQDFSKVQQIITNTFDQVLTAKADTETIRYCMVSIINILLNGVWEMGNQLDEEFLRELDPMNKLLACQSVSDLKREIEALLKTIASHVQATQISPSDEALKRVMAYVQENYQNSDLSVTEVAQRMDMQVSTLSRLFKKKTGQGLLEYINGLRVQEVIQKLQETNRSIGDIAADMGFINVNTMIRIFKRYTGCTPGRYRQMLTQNKEE